MSVDGDRTPGLREPSGRPEPAAAGNATGGPSSPGSTAPAVVGDGARRQLALAVLLCLAGAGLAVFAATRTWSVEVTARPAPLPGLRTARTGGDLLPWLTAVAVVGLAGAGAVLASRGAARRLVGVLLLLVGCAVAVGGGYGVTTVQGGVGPLWPVLCALGGVLTAAGGAYTVVRGRSWPGMGARYERAAAGGPAAGPRTGSGGDGPIGGAATKQAWDALDRGEDPTVSGPSGS